MQYDDHVSKKICLVVSCLIPIHCFAQLPQDSRRAGGIAIIPLTANTTPIQFDIKPYAYAEQRLTVKNQDYVNPNQDQLDRYTREAKEQNDIYTSFNPSTWTTFPDFIRPTAGKWGKLDV